MARKKQGEKEETGKAKPYERPCSECANRGIEMTCRTCDEAHRNFVQV
jgi:recombinational DNA repair protein RecR